MTPEDRFKMYFGDKEIHPMAYEEISLIDWAKYDRKESASYLDQEIPVKSIVGTVGKNGGKGYRWADILIWGKKSYDSQWDPKKIAQILAYEASDIFLIKDVHKGEYYIHSEGHHRVPFWKCMGKEKIAAQVREVQPLKGESDFSGRLPEPNENQNFLTILIGFFQKT